MFFITTKEKLWSYPKKLEAVKPLQHKNWSVKYEKYFLLDIFYS